MKKKNEKEKPGLFYKKSWIPHSYYMNVEVAEGYDARRFSSFPGKIFDQLEKYNLRKAFSCVESGAHVLDCPCGTGRLAETLLELGHEVTGADISPEMLDVACRKLIRFGSRFSSKISDARDLHNESDRFKAALCARVLMHFPIEEQIEFLRNVAGVTEGFVILTHSLNTPYQRFRRLLKHILHHQAPVAYPVTESELAQLLQRAGLRESKRYRLMPLLSEAMIVVASKTGSQ